MESGWPGTATASPWWSVSTATASYYENGQIQTQGEFRDGQYHGVWTAWWENGAKMKVAEFDHGAELSREYFPESD